MWDTLRSDTKLEATYDQASHFHNSNSQAYLRADHALGLDNIVNSNNSNHRRNQAPLKQTITPSGVLDKLAGRENRINHLERIYGGHGYKILVEVFKDLD